MDLRDLLSVLRRRWRSAVLVALVVLAAATGATLLATPQYTASTRLFFGVPGGDTVTDLAQGSTFTAKQMGSYAEVATSPLVLDRVISDVGLTTTAAELADRVTAVAPPDTVILEISVTDPNAGTAAAIGNAIARQVASVTADLTPARADGSDAVRATVLAPATAPDAPSSPSLVRNLALGLLAGAGLGVGLALLRHTLDTKIRGEQDVRTVTERSILGVVPFDSGAPSHPVVMHDDPLGARSEAVRRLRTNLQFVDVASARGALVITSSVPGEGKSTTAINLAVSMADAGKRVLLVDADLRRPSVAEYLGLEGAVGLTTVLIGRADLADVVQSWQETTVDVLPSGQIPPNPSELLGSAAMESLLAQFTSTYDVVVLDSPPLLPVTDAAVLSKLAGSVLVVVGADRIHKPQLRESLETLETVGSNIVGLVLNKIARNDTSSYQYYGAYRSYSNKPEIPGAAQDPVGPRPRPAGSVDAPPAADHTPEPAIAPRT
jgi:succinoglycan biosynthesis transport protein ExoP